MEENQLPLDIPPYEPRRLTGSRRAGIKYKSYTQEEFENAMKAVQQGEMSLRKASIKYNVPKTTLAEKLGDSCPNLPPLGARKNNKIGTRYTWTEAEMAQAIASVQAGTSVSEAARQFGVPPSNLNSRTRGREPKDLKGEVTRLTLKQESLLVEWASAQCQLGFPPSKDEIYELAEKVLKKSGSDKSLGKQWVGHWLRRHPHIQALDWKPKPKEKRQSRSFTTSGFALEEGDASLLEAEVGEGVVQQHQHQHQHPDMTMDMGADISPEMAAAHNLAAQNMGAPNMAATNMTAHDMAAHEMAAHEMAAHDMAVHGMTAHIPPNIPTDMANMSHMPIDMAAHMATEMAPET